MPGMRVWLYCASWVLLLGLAVFVFRVAVRRDYARYGRLRPLESALQLAVWALCIALPFLYNPARWIWFWLPGVPVSPPVRFVGVVLTVTGMVIAFGTMLWFGLGRAFGVRVQGLQQHGPYRWTRNPQVAGMIPMIAGVVILWPSWFAVGWALLLAIVAHLMVTTEEEHLERVFGDEYRAYRAQVPRYVPRLRRTGPA